MYLAVLAGFSCGTRPRARGTWACARCSDRTAIGVWSHCGPFSRSSPSLQNRTCRLRHFGRKRRDPIPRNPRVLGCGGHHSGSSRGTRPPRSARRRSFPRPCSTKAKYAGFEYGWVRGVGSAAFVAGTLVAAHAADRFGLSVIMWLSAAALLAFRLRRNSCRHFLKGQRLSPAIKSARNVLGCYYFASERLSASLWSARSFSAVTRCMIPLL
jgi:hypothetical protein